MTATVAQIEAYAARIANDFPRFVVAPNGYGVRVECKVCHNSSTGDRAEMWARNHTCVDPTAKLVIHMSANGGWNMVKVTFSRDEDAARYISTHLHLVLNEDEDDNNDWHSFPLAYAALYPMCEHQMDARSCSGPNHFGEYDQERRDAGY